MGRAPHDKNAPRRPSTAFMLFMKERRLQSEHVASLPFGERNRTLGVEWNALPQEKKDTYLLFAKEDRERYKLEFVEYTKSDAYKSWLATVGNQATKQRSATGQKSTKRAAPIDVGDLEQDESKVPIFTREFLEYNRIRDVVLRQLKKQAVQLEEETALLSKHVDNLTSAEVKTQDRLKAALDQYAYDEDLLKKFYKELVATLSGIDVQQDSNTGGTEHITETSVESFLTQLTQLCKSGTNPDMTVKVTESIKTAISKKTLKLVL